MSSETMRHDLRSSTRPKHQGLQVAALSMVAIEVEFWLYSIYFIKGHDDLNGSGLEVIAMIPITAITLFLTLPALSLSLVRRTLWFAFGLAVLAGVADIAIWARIVVALSRATGRAS